MTKQFEVRWEAELPGDVEQVWDAITARSAGWLWHIDYEPRVGGAERGLTGNGGTVTAWDPPRHFATAAEDWCGGRDGEGSNELDYRLEDRDGATYVRFRHRTAVPEDEYDVQLDACRHHTAFYKHSLGEYVSHFAGRDPVYVSADAPEESASGGFADVTAALGLSQEPTVGEPVTFRVDGLEPVDGVVDYATSEFLGVRSEDALYRFYGRDAWGWPVGIGHHLFGAGVDEATYQRCWAEWLQNVFTTKKAVA